MKVNTINQRKGPVHSSHDCKKTHLTISSRAGEGELEVLLPSAGDEAPLCVINEWAVVELWRVISGLARHQ